LKPFTTYTCTIYGVATSIGLKSDPITVTTGQQGWNLRYRTNLTLSIASAPNPPVLLSVTTIGSQSVQVNWRAPTQPNGMLIGYTITYNIDKDSFIDVNITYDGSVVSCHMCIISSSCVHFVNSDTIL